MSLAVGKKSTRSVDGDLDLSDARAYLKSCEKEMRRIESIFKKSVRTNKIIKHRGFKIYNVKVTTEPIYDVRSLMGFVENWYDKCGLDDEECEFLDSKLDESDLTIPVLNIEFGNKANPSRYEIDVIRMTPKMGALSMKTVERWQKKLFIDFKNCAEGDKMIKLMLYSHTFTEKYKFHAFASERAINTNFVVIYDVKNSDDTDDVHLGVCSALFTNIIENHEESHEIDDGKAKSITDRVHIAKNAAKKAEEAAKRAKEELDAVRSSISRLKLSKSVASNKSTFSGTSLMAKRSRGRSGAGAF